MPRTPLGRALSLARQGLELGIDFGPHSVEALLWVAETVEESVYLAGSLVGEARGVRFTLSNPPLRAGAFSAFRLVWNGAPVDPRCLRIRSGDRSEWRAADSLSATSPIDLLPGCPIEVFAEIGPGVGAEAATVRLELECPAIPPLVWIEFRDRVRVE